MKNLKKTEAINLSIQKEILVDKNNCTYASRNSNPKAPVYWANPEIVCLKQDWWLILNDWNLQEINVFCIPANTFTVKQISTRSDDPNRLDIRILCGDSNFTNTRGAKVSFARYLIKTLPYPSAGKKSKKTVKKSASASKNDFDLLIDEFGSWLLDEGIVKTKKTALSYKSYVKALARGINKVYGKNWFENFPLFYTDDEFAKQSNLYNFTNIFLNGQKQSAKGLAKKNWTNRQSGFKRFINFLESKYSNFNEEDDDFIVDNNETTSSAQLTPTVTRKITDSTVIEELNHQELMNKFKSRAKSWGRYYPDFGSQNGFFYLAKTVNKLFSDANDDRWEKLLEDDFNNNLHIFVGPNKNDYRVFNDVIKMEYLGDGTFRVIFSDGIFTLYTRTSDNKIIPEKTSGGWKDVSIDHIISLDNDLRSKVNSLPTMRKITDLIVDCLNELGIPYKDWRYESKWWKEVYDEISTELAPLRNLLYHEICSLDRQYELMDKSQNSSKGKQAINNDILTIKGGVVVECIDKKATSVVIPEGVTEIGVHAFYERESLKSVVIPSSVTTIGNRAFFGCESLTTIEIPANVRKIGEEAFGRCESLKSVVIPKGVTSIGKYVFSGCTSLESVVIQNGVPSIGKLAFYNCTSLASVEIPESVEAIGEEAFGSCKSLKSVKIPEGTKTISSNAFCDCESLESVVIPSSVTSISEDAFENCTSLEDVEFGCTLAEWKLNGWNETISAKIVKCSDDVWCKPSLLVEEGVVVECLDKTKTYIKIPAGVKRIGYEAFKDCSELMCVVIPTTVTTIDESAFDGCTSLAIVVYKGTKKAWEVIKERLKISKTVPAKVVKCSDGDVAL